MPTQPTHTALPVTFLSLFLISLIISAMTTDNGFSTIAKATCKFLLILTLIILTTQMILQPNTQDGEQNDDDDDDDSVESDVARPEPLIEPPSVQQTPAQRAHVSSSEPALSERATRRKLQKEKIYERADMEEEMRLHGLLKEQVKQRNNELLGKRKEVSVEVLGEDV